MVSVLVKTGKTVLLLAMNVYSSCAERNSVNKAKITGCCFLTARYGTFCFTAITFESAASSLYNHSSNSLTYKAIKQYKSIVFIPRDKLLDPIKFKIKYKPQ